jgi:hypothetical protein
MLEMWSVGTFTDGFVDMFTDEITVNTFTDRSKSLVGFLKFLDANINSLPTEFIATDNNKCFVNNTVEKIDILNPPSHHLVHFFSQLFISISLHLSVCI